MKYVNIIIKDISRYGEINEVAIHVKNPSFNELVDAVNTATKDNFRDIYVYWSFSKRQSCHNIFKNSTWKKLLRIFPDTRYGEIREYYTTLGEGFKIYF